MVGQIELFGAALGLLTFRQELADSDVIHFVDSDSATAALLKALESRVPATRLIRLALWVTTVFWQRSIA
eukprot:3762701-Amphidinium_carterae.1